MAATSERDVPPGTWVEQIHPPTIDALVTGMVVSTFTTTQPGRLISDAQPTLHKYVTNKFAQQTNVFGSITQHICAKT